MKTLFRFRVAAGLALFAATPWASAQPVITTEPVDALLSQGVNLSFRVIATGATSYQWWFKDAAIDPAINPSAALSRLSLTNVTLADAGPYFAIVSDAGGSTTSRVATLTVDPTFIKVTTGPLVTDSQPSNYPAWCDVDGDGLPDAYVPNNNASAAPVPSRIYRNLGGDAFERMTNAITAEAREIWGGVWADIDNDGLPDLYAVGAIDKNGLFHNAGNRVFSSIKDVATADSYYHDDASWVDVDGDGWVDLFVTTRLNSSGGARNDLFFHNRRDGSFEAWTTNQVGAIVDDGIASTCGAWCDVDNDGDLDLFVGNQNGAPILYRNDGTGHLDRVTTGSLPAPGALWAVVWADFNNDGWLDLVTSGQGVRLRLFLNRGNWQFEEVTTAAGIAFIGDCYTPAVGDFDNDGDLDLYVTNYYGKDLLYVNQGDGTFVAVDVGSPLTDGTSDYAVWVDYNNDGWLDLFKACGDLANAPNQLFRNNLAAAGNTNHWLKLKLQGIQSNRSAVGARITVQGRIHGQEVRQVRQVLSSATTPCAPSGLPVHFGLGDATNVDVVRIEWPSGNVDELTNVAPDQLLTVTEKIWITPQRPSASVNGSVKLSPTALGPFFQWQFQGTDLPGMTNAVLSLTNLTAAQQGRYSVVVDDGSGLVTNYTYLIVDPQFAKITEGPVVTDKVISFSGRFADYDNDDLPDLIVEGDGNTVGKNTRLYHNDGQGQFSAVSTGPWADLAEVMAFSAWADVDNDGDLDLYVGNGLPSRLPFYLRNDGGGAFTRLPVDKTWTSQHLLVLGANSAWGDLNGDGLLDAVVSGPSTYPLLNNGDGTFTVLTNSPIRKFSGWPQSIQFVDYDNDGDLDVFMPEESTSARLYRNDGQGQFTDVSASVLQGRLGPGAGGAWGDFDNDGDLDLYFVLSTSGSVFLVNNGDGTFTTWNGSPAALLKAGGNWGLPAWGDVDNDGWLDLFTLAPGRMFRNLGNGDFLEVTTVSPVKDATEGKSAVAADYNNDGALDLLVTRAPTAGNLLYQNNGNGNHWLKVRVRGTASDRYAIGAKVYARALINGKWVRQRRDISAGSATQEMEAHFGLGTANQVNQLRVEWPSGAVQEWAGVKTNQVLTVWEPPVLKAALGTDGACVLNMRAEPNRAWQVQASSDLATWETLATLTPTTVAFQYTDSAAAGMGCRFYRLFAE